MFPLANTEILGKQNYTVVTTHFFFFFFFFLWHSFIVAPLGSISELPAETCKEIKASEGQAVSKKYWLSTIKPGIPVLAYCDMNTEGKYSRTFPNEYFRNKETSLLSRLKRNSSRFVASWPNKVW